MHAHSIDHWRHRHAFLGAQHDRNERRAWFVVALTVTMMVVEIVGGTMFGSMALVADGWHMSTHAAALSIAGFAYWFARKHRDDPRFTFGTGKIGELAGFASAVILGLVALFIGYESVQRILAPVTISYSEAILIAVVGLGVNVLSAFLLNDDDEHGHHHHHDDHAHGNHHDTNFRAAYVHVLADALTSILAIIALLSARFYGWVWMDPAVGLIGAVVIAFWSFGLMRSAGRMLLDMVPESALSKRIIERLELKDDRVSDLLWRGVIAHWKEDVDRSEKCLAKSFARAIPYSRSSPSEPLFGTQTVIVMNSPGPSSSAQIVTWRLLRLDVPT